MLASLMDTFHGFPVQVIDCLDKKKTPSNLLEVSRCVCTYSPSGCCHLAYLRCTTIAT